MKTFLQFTIVLLFISDLQAKIIYIEPVRDAKYVSVENNIIIGFDEIIQSSNLNTLLTVTGNLSGVHSGKIVLTEERKKLIFFPDQPFAFGEKVEVRLNNLRTSSTYNNTLKYYFQTQIKKVEVDFDQYLSNEMGYKAQNNFLHSSNYAFLPNLTVTVSNNPSPGQIFLTNTINLPHKYNLIIANNDGTLNFTREYNTQTFDYSRQPNGLMTYFTAEIGRKYYAEDSLFNKVDSFYCGNGYFTDFHELRLLNNGHALLMSYDPQPVDMSLIVPGGDPNAIVTGLIIQEIDENKNVVFQWRSWDHFDIVDAIYENLTSATVDYAHGNAIELDIDGNLMISSRHLNEITKINRSTGEIMWRMGGVNNEFTFVNDTIPFHYQHHIRRIANGNITLFDNGNYRTPLMSRALEYQIDEVNKTATLVWQYVNDPVIYGPFMGSVQRLKNGNTLIGWGGGTSITMTEVTPTGDIALEMSLPAGIWAYRAFRDEVNVTLNAKIAIEGFYNSVSDQLRMNDTVRAYVRSATSPFGIIDSAKSVVDSVNFNGNFRFYNVPDGTYYVATKHRNGLETWSKAGGEAFVSGGVYQYDFTSAAANSYGSNAVLKGSKYCFYSGDVNQDGDINISDVLLIYNDASNNKTGYVNTDLNGDNNIDLSDLLISYNNATNFVASMTP